MIESIMFLINDIPVWWYLPAGTLETIYWGFAFWISYRFNRDLHRNIHDIRPTVYVKSDTTKWQGFVEIK